MRKVKNVLFLFLMSLFGFVNVYAVEDVDYKVVASYISADIDISGSLHVKEAYVTKGSLNGFRRKIEYKNEVLDDDWEAGKVDFYGSSFYNARGVTLSKASALKIEESEIDWSILNKEYTWFTKEETSEEGSTGVYTLEELSNGVEVKNYSPSSSGYMVYYFEYYVDQAIMLHNDVAEIYYTFFKLDDDVKKVNIQLTLPGVSTAKNYRVWAHGSLNGEITPISDQKDDEGNYLYRGAYAELEDYKAGDAVEIRMTFDKELAGVFSQFLNNSKMDALEEIEKVEGERAEEANRKRKFIKVMYYGGSAVGIVYLVGLVILWIYIYTKYDKEHKVNFDMHYYREFTGDYEPEVVDYLMKKDITTDAMNASIMNLIYKHNIDIEEYGESKASVDNYDMKSKGSKDVTLVEKSRENINDTEKILMELLFDTIGKDGKCTLKEIEKYSSNYTTAEKFMKKYESWKFSAKGDALKENFFESNNNIRVLGTVYFFIAVILLIMFLVFGIQNFILIALLFIIPIIFLIYLWTFKKWSTKGREHYLKWEAFKNFLKDFGTLDEKEVPEIKLWDRYLVYATVLGVAKEVQKAMKVRLSSMGIDEATYTGYRPLYYRDYYMFNRISSSMSTAYTKSTNAINAHNASSSMSSSGFGGGFSGGGGFAGGGGGGGGF